MNSIGASILIICALFLSFCERTDARVVVINNSDKPIIFAYGRSSAPNELDDLAPYPTNELGRVRILKNGSLIDSSSVVLPHTSKRMHKFGDWESIFTNNYKTSVYILDTDIILNNSWSDIKTENMIMKEIKLSRNDLIKRNWRIVYP